jgi:hypothetical protein
MPNPKANKQLKPSQRDKWSRRLSVEKLRRITESAKDAQLEEKKEAARATLAKKREAERAQKDEALQLNRLAKIWKSLYRAAIDGDSFALVENLSEEAESVFTALGLRVTETYRRAGTKFAAKGRVETRAKELDSLLAEARNQYAAYQKIREWRDANRVLSLNYQRGWFIEDICKGNIISLADIDGFSSLISKGIKDEQCDEEVARLKKLLALIENLRSLKQFNFQDSQSYKKIADLKNEIAVLKRNENYLQPNNVSRVCKIEWRKIHKSFSFSDDDFSAGILTWLSSRWGQKFLSDFDGEVMNVAREGKNSLEVRVSFPRQSDGACRFSGEFGELDTFGPNIREFKSIAKTLGYKPRNTGRDGDSTIITVEWR